MSLREGGGRMTAQSSAPNPSRGRWAWLRWFNAERITAIVILGVGIYLIIGSFQLRLFTKNGSVGAGLFPFIVAIVLTGLTAVWVGTLVFRKRIQDPANPLEEVVDHALGVEDVHDADHDYGKAIDEATQEAIDEYVVDERHGRRRLIVVVAASIVMIPLITYLGMVVDLYLYISAMLIFVAKVKWWKALVWTLLGAAVLAYGGYKLGIYFPDPFGLNTIMARWGL